MLHRTTFLTLSLSFFGVSALADPTSVEHSPSSQVFSQPASITQREPDVPREDEPVDLWFRVSFQFTYDRVAIYYTTDGSTPSGSFGSPSGTTQVATNAGAPGGTITFQFNENSGGTRDWWKFTLPASARQYAQTIRYKISAWQQFSGPEVFANSGNSYSYINKLAWPGSGAGQPNPSAGYPPVSFWKEEAVFGNTFTAGMIDQNGAVYDMHFPTPGGVYGVGTRNEGYVDGDDTFPPGLPQGWRGQMHLNQAMLGIRVNGLTHWMSNPQGVSYSEISQGYAGNTNVIRTLHRLNQAGADLRIEEFDFAPAGIAFPTDGAAAPQRHIYLKRALITNQSASPASINLYWYLDPALNGGDGYDAMFFDPARNAMVAYDNIYRVVTGTGTGFTPPNEYNPTTDAGYEKNKSVYLATAMKIAAPGGPGGAPAAESWRDTSADNSQGWLGSHATIAPFSTIEVDIVMAGAVDDFAGASGTYSFKLDPVMQWFSASNTSSIQQSTENYWTNWLASGVAVTTPDADLNSLFTRGLLATALHVDAVNGGVIAGFHNGAYPYVWPRDAVYAAITLARTGHTSEAAGVYTWMRDTCFRSFEPWGRKGFWKQKYSTDGYVIWGAPQIDETACFPWGIKYQYDLTSDAAFLASHAEALRDSINSMTRDSSDNRLRFEEAFGLVYSNNVWEDSYDTFLYSNANVHRGLDDAATCFDAINSPADAAYARSFRDTIKSGLDARLDWNGENTDISQLGISYPFSVYSPTDARVALVANRINGAAADRFGNIHPLYNANGEHAGSVNRYWGDGYWGGGPWFLSTLWQGLYYAQRADLTPGTADIDTHKQRIDMLTDRLGPTGLGAEQIAYSNSYLYPGGDFRLQAAWPNAWESMSTFVDAVMIFLDYRPDAPHNTIHIRPKLPSAWTSMTFSGITLIDTPAGRTHKVAVTVSQDQQSQTYSHAFTNTTGFALSASTVIRIPPGVNAYTVTRNGQPWPFTFDQALGAVTIAPTALEAGAGALTTFTVSAACPADFNSDGFLDFFDLDAFILCFEGAECPPGKDADFNHDAFIDFFDIDEYVVSFETGC